LPAASTKFVANTIIKTTTSTTQTGTATTEPIISTTSRVTTRKTIGE